MKRRAGTRAVRSMLPPFDDADTGLDYAVPFLCGLCGRFIFGYRLQAAAEKDAKLREHRLHCSARKVEPA